MRQKITINDFTTSADTRELSQEQMAKLLEMAQFLHDALEK